MTRKALLVLAASLTLVFAAACGGGSPSSSSPTTTTSTPPVTTTSETPTTTSQTPTTTSETPTTTSEAPATTQQAETTSEAPSGGGALSETAIAITNHSAAVLKAYNGLCLTCHGAGTTNQFPLPDSWDGTAAGSTKNPGVYTITVGSDADHTGRTSDQCTQDGCHAAPAP